MRPREARALRPARRAAQLVKRALVFDDAPRRIARAKASLITIPIGVISTAGRGRENLQRQVSVDRAPLVFRTRSDRGVTFFRLASGAALRARKLGTESRRSRTRLMPLKDDLEEPP